MQLTINIHGPRRELRNNSYKKCKLFRVIFGVHNNVVNIFVQFRDYKVYLFKPQIVGFRYFYFYFSLVNFVEFSVFLERVFDEGSDK